MLFAFTLLALLPWASASCRFTQPNKWGNGCQVSVYVDPWVAGQELTLKLGNGGSVRNVWGATKQSTSGNSVTFKLNNENRNDVVIIIDGTEDVQMTSCAGSSGGSAATDAPVVTSAPSGGSDGSDDTNSGSGSTAEGLLTPSTKAKSGKARLTEFVNSLSNTAGSNSLGTIRVIQSSGGAAGGVISEGQGYGLLIAGQVAAATGDATAIKYAVEIFNGWREMCKKSKDDKSCQGGKYYCDGNPCLPHWKFSSDMSYAQGTGGAPDGDEDAILGMILLLSATDSSSLSSFDEIAKWTYHSCKAFMDVNTVGGTGEMLKLGTCWGGWDCSNPSYFSPGHYRAMRDFMKKYKSKYGGSDPDYTAKWNKLITISYQIMQANQCPTTGLVTNWWKPDKSNPSSGGTTSGCSGSGTPSAEFGAEASRTIWRFVLDYMWYASEATEGLGAATFASRVAKHATQKFGSDGNLGTCGNVQSIHSGWLSNDFMWAPTVSSLVVKTGASGQQAALDKAVTKINQRPINDYYSGSWVAIVTEVFNGETTKAGQKLKAFLE